jgi:hypothetical protein
LEDHSHQYLQPESTGVAGAAVAVDCCSTKLQSRAPRGFSVRAGTDFALLSAHTC